VALIETKVKLSKLKRLEGCVPRHWLSSHNFDLSSRGRNWISWNREVRTCVTHTKSVQQITLHVNNKRGLEGYLTVVYALHTLGERLHMWKELQDTQISNDPWLITGGSWTRRLEGDHSVINS